MINAKYRNNEIEQTNHDLNDSFNNLLNLSYTEIFNEMKELIAQRAIVGGFTLNSYYWTSSEHTTNLSQTDGSTYANTAWIQQNQSTIPVPGEAGKTYGNVAVRPIRSF